MKRVIITALALALCLACVPLLSGCSASVAYTLNTDDEGNQYYTVGGSGYISNLKGELVIPAYYGSEEKGTYAPVTEIAQKAFASASITKVTIPETVTKIGNAAFAYCYSLKTVSFAEDSAIDEIAQGLFAYCSILTEINIPETVKKISAMSFYNCQSISELTLPAGLETIGAEAFANCTCITSVTLPETLTTIGNLAFYNTTGLTEIIIPASVHDIKTTVIGEDGEVSETVIYGIGYGAFHTCKSLVRAVIKGEIETIRSGAFGYCTSLTEIYLPSTIKSVEGAMYSGGKLYCGHAFHNCDALTDVYFGGSQEEWDKVEIDSTSVTDNGATYNNSALIGATKHYNAVYNG